MRKRLSFPRIIPRLTFGRMLYRANVPVAAIAKTLGHDDITTSLKYLGIDMDDMTSAMRTLELYQSSLMNGVF